MVRIPASGQGIEEKRPAAEKLISRACFSASSYLKCREKFLHRI
jgi:hypothetical protein